MALHDWTRVGAATFHDFHGAWITHLKEALNGGILPRGYYAMSEQHAGPMIADVLTLRGGQKRESPPASGGIAIEEKPPKVSLEMVPDETVWYRMARRTLAIHHTSDHRIVALIEIVSPANKDRRAIVNEFVEKVLLAFEQGYHVLLADILPPGPFDPQGFHGAIWKNFDAAGYTPAGERSLTLASYAVKDLPRAYVEPMGAGARLPDMPLFLHADRYVNVPLEETYDLAFSGMSSYWRDVLEGQAG